MGKNVLISATSTMKHVDTKTLQSSVALVVTFISYVFLMYVYLCAYIYMYIGLGDYQ